MILIRAAPVAACLAQGVLEVRSYTIKPEGMTAFLKLCRETAPLRCSLLPLMGFFTCETGGDLNVVTHLYSYQNLDQRDAMRQAAIADPRWTAFVAASREHVAHQESRIMLEASRVYDAVGAGPAATFVSPVVAGDGKKPPGKPVYEMRTYQLHPGYGSVPKLLDAFSSGLPSKIAADREGRLVMLAYTDVGVLNTVTELWRYPSAQACIRAREAARTVQAWRDTIATVTPTVQWFRSSFLTPASFSPWQ